MRRNWKNFVFHNPDEMERAILFKAQRNAYVFLAAALLIWSLYESYKVYTCHSALNPLPCFLLTMAVVIQSFSQLIMTHHAVKDDEDSHETGPMVKMILLACVIFSITATVAAAVVLMGVRI